STPRRETADPVARARRLLIAMRGCVVRSGESVRVGALALVFDGRARAVRLAAVAVGLAIAAAHRCPHVRAHTRGRLAGAKVVGEVAGVVGVDAHLAGRTAQPCEAATLVATTRTTLANMRDVDARGRRFAVVAVGNVVAATHRCPDIRAGVGAWLTASAATTDGFVRAAVIRTTIGAHGTDEVE